MAGGTAGRTPRLSKAEYETLAAFRYALRHFFAFSEAAANKGGLLPQQYQALLAVKAAREDTISIAELARQLFIKHNSAVGLVDRMELEGLVVREAAPTDLRRVNIRLTPKGTRLLQRLAATHRAELRRIGPELNKLLASLSKRTTRPG